MNLKSSKLFVVFMVFIVMFAVSAIMPPSAPVAADAMCDFDSGSHENWYDPEYVLCYNTSENWLLQMLLDDHCTGAHGAQGARITEGPFSHSQGVFVQFECHIDND